MFEYWFLQQLVLTQLYICSQNHDCIYDIWFHPESEIIQDILQSCVTGRANTVLTILWCSKASHCLLTGEITNCDVNSTKFRIRIIYQILIPSYIQQTTWCHCSLDEIFYCILHVFKILNTFMCEPQPR